VAASSESSSRARGLVIAALLSLHLIWGSTYYAMRVALETLPPYLMGGSRFLIAGLLLFVVLRLGGAALPKPREWLAAGAVGTLLLVMGNGFVVLAERSILKIVRFLPFGDARVRNGALAELSRDVFRAMLPIVTL